LGNQDQAFQEVQSSGCSTVFGVCTSSYILAYSTQTPFVFKLDFKHPLSTTDLDPGSNTYFLSNDGPELSTGFYGSIDGIKILPLEITPIPAALPLFTSGLGIFGLLGWRKKRKARAVA
jgi:hypothetical protein